MAGMVDESIAAGFISSKNQPKKVVNGMGKSEKGKGSQKSLPEGPKARAKAKAKRCTKARERARAKANHHLETICCQKTG